MLPASLDHTYWRFATLIPPRKVFGSIVLVVSVQMSSPHQSLYWSIGKSVEVETRLRCTTHLQAGHLDTRASRGLACSIYHYSCVPNSGCTYPFCSPRPLPDTSPPSTKSLRHPLPTKLLTPNIIIEMFATEQQLHQCICYLLPWSLSAQPRTSLFLDGSIIVIMVSTSSLEA